MFCEIANPFIRRILQEVGLVAGSMRPYVVGGFVRDSLMGKESQDLDVVVESSGSHNGITLAQKLADKWQVDVKSHQDFGTATVNHPEGLKIDFVTARCETYTQAGILPTVKFSQITDDLWRRDFSVNAIAISLSSDRFEQVLDPTNGIADLEGKRIRVLHAESFSDDPTRIFRALRYAVRFQFQIETETETLMQSAIDRIGILSDARIRNEIERIFQEACVVEIMQWLSALGICQAICPQWQLPSDFESIWHNLQSHLEWAERHLDNDVLNAEALPWMALNLPATGQERLSLPGRLRQKLVAHKELAQRLLYEPLTPMMKPSQIYQFLKPHPIEALVYHLPQPQIEQYLTQLRRIKPNKTGNDLIADGWTAGPNLAQALWEDFARQLDKCG